MKDIEFVDCKKTVGFEEALTLTGVGKYNYIFQLITQMMIMTAALELFSSGMIVAAAQCDLELDVYRKGLVSSLPMLGVIASAHMWGYIADTRGRRFSLTLSMLGCTFFALVSGLVNHWVLLAAAKFFSAAFASGTTAVSYAMLGEMIPKSHRSRFLLYTSSGVNLTQLNHLIFTYPILKLTFAFKIPILNINYRPWRLLTQIFGVYVFAVFLLMYLFTMESPKYYFAKGDDEKGMEILRKIYVKNTGKSVESYPVSNVILEEKVAVYDKNLGVFRSVWNQTVPLFNGEYIKNTLILSYLAIIVYAINPPLVYWLPMIFESFAKNVKTRDNFCSVFAESKEDVSSNVTMTVCDDTVSDFTIFTSSGLAIYLLLGSLLIVPLVKCAGKKKVFIGYNVVCAMLCASTNQIYNVGSLVMFVASHTQVACMGLVTTYSVEMFPTYLRAMGVSLTIMVGRAFAFISINMIGPLLQSQCNLLLYMLAGLMLSGAVVALFLPSDKNISTHIVKNDEKKSSQEENIENHM